MSKSLIKIMVACIFLGSPLHAQTAAQLEKTSEDFTQVAKEAIPAVVSIQVKSPSKLKSFYYGNGGDQEDDNPLDLFGDDLFGRFFGIPRREGATTQPQISQASGFIVSPDGHILTNNHVVREQGSITVLLGDGREFEGKVIGQDQATDLALIKIDATNLPYLKLGNSDLLQIGQWVVAIGNPFGLQASLTVGVVM